MKIDGRLFIGFIVALIMIPGTCAVSFGGGTSISGSGSAQGIVVATGTQVAGISTASGVMSGMEDHWIGDTSGKLAEVSFDVENAAKWTHDWTLSPGGKSKDQTIFTTAQSSVSAQEWLDVTNADSIQANAKAGNGEGDQANVGISMSVGSIANLAGYTNSATVTAAQAKASQSATSASGNQIIFNAEAYNAELDNANLNLEVQQGSVTGYASSATGTKTQAAASQSATTATGYGVDVLFGANNAEEDSASSNFDAYYEAVVGYANSETAKIGQVTASQSVKSVSGLQMIFGSSATNSATNAELEGAMPYFEVDGGSVTGYSTSETVTKSQVTASQSATLAHGNEVYANSWASNNNAGSQTNTDIAAGQLLGYSDKATVTKTSTQISPVINTATGGYIVTGSSARNAEGDNSLSGLQITNGKLSGYSSPTATTTTSAQTSPSITAATGSLIDLTSHADDTRLASEYLTSSDGSTTQIPTPYGGADFEYQSGSLAATKLQSTATSSNVAITPTLPTSVKNAIMLEPMNYAFTQYAGATDLGTTVFPDLVGKGYATLRYTDAGASIDKFQNLGKYNVVLVDSHMNSQSIGLSTTGGYLGSYTTSKKSMVILAGCDSFDGYPTIKSGLATWVKGASLSGGYANTVSTNWNNDYLGYFFDALSNGNTASAANTAANNAATTKYGSGQYNLPLVFYGNQLFTLQSTMLACTHLMINCFFEGRKEGKNEN